MPREGQYTEAEAKDLLDDYVVPEECASSSLPTDLAPGMASAYIRDEVKADFDAFSMERAMEVARFYTLRDRTAQLTGLINGGEKTVDDVNKACSLLAAVSTLGTADEQRKTVDEFHRLLMDPVAEEADALQMMILAFFSLPPRTPSKALSERVIALRARCERKGPESELSQYVENERGWFRWIIQEKGRKDWMIKMPAGPEKLRRWAEAYLIFDMNTPFQWDVEAGYGLLGHARDDGDQAAVQAIKEAMARIDPDKDPTPALRFRKTRGYRAREYFLDTLDEMERRDRDKHLEEQDDLIM